MAKAKGFLDLNGSIDGVNYYRQKGVEGVIARKAGGGFNAKAIKTKASMEPVRQTGSEFGRVSRFVKLFKVGIVSLLPELKSHDFHSRLVGLFMAIKAADVGAARGMRMVEAGLQTEQGRKALLGYSLFDAAPLLQPFYKIVSYDSLKSIIGCSPIEQVGLVFPKGATQVQFQAGVLMVDFEQELTSLTLSEPVVFSKQGLASFELGFPETDVAVTGVRFVVLMVSFFEPNGGEHRRLPGRNGYYGEVVGCGLSLKV